MSVENRSLLSGAVAPPPSEQDQFTGTDGTTPNTNYNYASRGVFNTGTDTTTVGGDSSSSTSGTTTGGGTGGSGNANDTTITLTAGTSIMGGGDFTTNQAAAETINFALTNTGVTAGTFGSATQIPVIQVDAQGRIVSLVLADTTQPVNFDDGLEQRVTTSGGIPARTSGGYALPTTDGSFDVTVDVDNGYTLGTVTPNVNAAPTGVTTTTPVLNTDMTEATYMVMVPAETTGEIDISTTVMSTHTETGQTETETTPAVMETLYVPFYTRLETTMQTSFDLTTFTVSDAAITNGATIFIAHPNPGTRQFAYFALEQVAGRNYMFSLGSFNISFDSFETVTAFGRTFQVYEFPTNGNVNLTVNF